MIESSQIIKAFLPNGPNLAYSVLVSSSVIVLYTSSVIPTKLCPNILEINSTLAPLLNEQVARNDRYIPQPIVATAGYL